MEEVNNINAWSNGGNKEIEDKRINNVENVPTVELDSNAPAFVFDNVYTVNPT